MSVYDQKKKVMGNIAALNTITEGLPKFKRTDSFSSMNNDGNSTNFLLDLTQALIGYQELKENIVDILTRKLPEIESEIKKKLKLELKEYTSCGVNPNIPSWFKSTGVGVTLKLSNIDFFQITKTDPKSAFGFLIYNDFQSGTNSTDFNTFLYSNIEQNKSDYTPNGGTPSPWGTSTVGTNILDLKFSPVGSPTIVPVSTLGTPIGNPIGLPPSGFLTVPNNNIIKITTNPAFDNKTLSEFNEKFIDSIYLFGDPNNYDGTKILNAIIDNLFGTMSVEFGKTKEQLKKEAEINEVLKCILNSDENDFIDDNYFEFDNEQLSKIETDVNNKRLGIKVLETCGNLVANIPISELIDASNAFTAATANQLSPLSVDELKSQAISKAIDNIAAAQASNAATIDIPTVKYNFILDLIKSFTQSVITIILSPRLITLFAVNFKIIYGQLSEYDGAIDFMKKNKNLIISISKTVLEIIIKMLITLVLKYISKKLAKKIADDKKEKSENYNKVMLSLLGVTPDIITQIQNINYFGA
jgi:hypothetical protein